jgi:hypothetical protein
MQVAEKPYDPAAEVREKRILCNKFPDYKTSIVRGALKKLPPQPDLLLSFQTIKPIHKLQRFDGSWCGRDGC